MSNQSNIQLVCFDLGEVLVQLVRNWAHACSIAGVPWDRDGIDDATRARVLDAVARHEVGAIEQDQYAAELADLLAMDPTHTHRVSTCWLCGPYPGVPELLDRVIATGIRTACLSNTNAHHWQLMTTPGSPNHLPLDRLTYRFASHLIGARKPDAAIYEHVERTAGLPPASILFFDNAEENITAAAARGWHAIQVDPADPVPQMTACMENLGLLPKSGRGRASCSV